MLWYPQLSTGAMVQYPFRSTRKVRTIVNETADGNLVRTADPAAPRTAWRLSYRGLTDAEVRSIEELFEASDGGVRTFGFLDPGSNLLRWTEDLTKSEAWARGPHVEISAKPGDGSSRQFELTNRGQAAETVLQSIKAPGWFEYSGSAAVRAEAPCSVRLGVISGGVQCWASFEAGPAWTHAEVSARLNTSADDLAFGIEVAAGYRIEAKELQLEPQPGGGEYRPSYSRGGVYLATRFDQTQLRISTYGPDDNRVTVALVSRD